MRVERSVGFLRVEFYSSKRIDVRQERVMSPPPYSTDKMDCQYCDEKTTEKSPFCDHHAHPVCVWAAHRFRFKDATLECPTCHAKQTTPLYVWKHAGGVEWVGDAEPATLLGLGSGQVYPLVVYPPVAAPAAAPRAAPAAAPRAAPAANANAQARARFTEHRNAGRIPNAARFGGIHNRYCGHRGCERRGGERGVRFVNGLYRCEVHQE